MKKKQTKLSALISQKGLSQSDVVMMILNKHGFLLGKDRMSKMCNGLITNPNTKIVTLLADVLCVPIDWIIEKDTILENVHENN